MNRSILIVTCDFLVLAAMSLSIGMNKTGDPVQNGRGGTTTPTTKLVSMIEEELSVHKQVLLDKKNLEAKFDELTEALHLAQAKILTQAKDLSTSSSENKEKQHQIDVLNQELAKASKEVSGLDKEIAGLQSQLNKKNTDIAQKQQQLNENLQKLSIAESVAAKASTQYQQAKEQLLEKNILLTSSERDLTLLKEQLREANKKAEETMEKLQKAELSLATTTSELTTKTKQLNGTIETLISTNQRLEDTKRELNIQKTETATVRENLVAAIAVGKEKEQQLKSKDEQLKVKDEMIKEKDDTIKEQDIRLRNNAISSYNNALIELRTHLKNERFMNGFQLDQKLYLPEVNYSGKYYLVTAFFNISGLLKHEGGFSKVSELEYKYRLPDDSENKWNPISKQMFCLNEDLRVALVPLEKASSKSPLKAISMTELKKRGINQLTLFKPESKGGVSVDLTGRCSLDLSGENPRLLIRNPNRSSAVPAAEIGDFIISKEGDYVGVIINVISGGLGQNDQAVCFVFPETIALTKTKTVSLNKSSTGFYDAFCEQVEILRKSITELNKENVP